MVHTIDLKQVIQEELLRKQKRNPRFSLRKMAEQLDIPAGRLSEILSGKRKVSTKLASKILPKIEFMVEGIDFYNKDAAAFHILPDDSFHAIADWYHFAIINLIETDNFRLDETWIAKRLGISTLEVRSALDRLKRLKLVQLKADKLVVNQENLTTTTDISSKALRLSHKQSLEQAIECLEEVPVDQRDITSITMAVDSTRISEAKNKIKKFRRELCRFLEGGEKKDEVFNLNVQLVPVTKPIK